MKGCFINGLGCVATQKTDETGQFIEVAINTTDNVLEAIEPSYSGLFPPAAGRRMAKGVKMGIYASTKALEQAGVAVPDAIITGTGMGCLKDSEKFLKAMLANDEQFLTPTNFIQSTHNTVGGQIALGLKCNGYNFTYVNGAVSFETALYDAKLQLESDEENSILIGGVDEMSEHTLELFKIACLIKKEEDKPYEVLHPTSVGIVQGEGAAFFVIESQQKENSYAQVVDVEIRNVLSLDKVEDFILSFLSENKLEVSDIDAILLGNNGDVNYDSFYESPKELFNNTQQLYYKHLTGEFNTASSVGLSVASQIIKNQHIEEIFKMNDIQTSGINTVLIYNQYRGIDHSLVLLKRC